MPAAVQIAIRFIATPDYTLSGKNNKFHIHAFVVFTANHSADDDVLARFRRSDEMKLLRSGLEEQIPSLNFGSVLGAQKSETMNRSIAIPGFASASRHVQGHRFAGLDGDLRRALPGDLVAAVAVGKQLNDAGLSAGAGDRSEHGASERHHD